MDSKEYHKIWYQKNIERERAKARIYSRGYRRTNKDKCEAYRKKLLKRDPEYNKKKVKSWRLRNKERVRSYNREYREKNKEKERVRNYAYNHLRNKMIQKLKCCQRCRSKDDLQIHHKEYNNEEGNLMLLCRSCHRKEHDKD